MALTQFSAPGRLTDFQSSAQAAAWSNDLDNLFGEVIGSNRQGLPGRELLAHYNAANTVGDVAKEYIEKMVAEGRAETTNTKATWLGHSSRPFLA